MEEVKCKCGSTDYHTEKSGYHLKAICNSCGSYIKFLAQGNTVHVMPFGQFKGTAIKDITDKRYLLWVLANTKVKGGVKQSIENRIKNLN
jgi:hypothetical protein